MNIVGYKAKMMKQTLKGKKYNIKKKQAFSLILFSARSLSLRDDDDHHCVHLGPRRCQLPPATERERDTKKKGIKESEAYSNIYNRIPVIFLPI